MFNFSFSKSTIYKKRLCLSFCDSLVKNKPHQNKAGMYYKIEKRLACLFKDRICIKNIYDWMLLGWSCSGTGLDPSGSSFKHRENCKTLPREHWWSRCQTVLTKRPFQSFFLLSWDLSYFKFCQHLSFEFLSFITRGCLHPDNMME